ncbi:hypothetical protein BCR44DRAFT_1404934 [Catenaria anguillulae PL171]|uniref:GEgh 16 protein n=1 Tax=Catenaria anguillulae PL171 TaxID=765915 RepID=A0A1Y2HBC4_9FUNG|nr:hypothetical protein BCR44DRAFT_1404934 [Catenaria anguillulae PL171]
MKLAAFVFTILAIATPLAHAHGAIVAAQGTGGPRGYALGILADTPRDGTRRNPFQRDTSVIRDSEIRSGRASPCGRTIAGGNNDIQAGVAAIMQDLGGLPEVTPGSQLTLTVHQVNADGAGPYRCDISMDGTGQDFQPVQVQRNLPGIFGVSVGGNATPQPLVLNMPAQMQCTGGPNGNMCMVRCRNNAVAGPFGGCVPVQQGQGGGNAGGATPPPAQGGADAGEGAAPAPAPGAGGAEQGGRLGRLGRITGGGAGGGAAGGNAAGGLLGGLLGGLGGAGRGQ